jgi:Leucine-rich repeat (LRR) protein
LHKAGRSNRDVRGIRSEGQEINFIPRDIDRFFPNIIALYLPNANIAEIYEEDFKPFPNLRMLWMMNNKIEVLEEHLFRNNPNLGEIAFNDNQLRQVSLNTFSILRLSYLYLNRNPCIDGNPSPQLSMSTLINKVRLQCFSFENDPRYQTCQRDNIRMRAENLDLNKMVGILLNAKQNLQEKLKKCEEGK